MLHKKGEAAQYEYKSKGIRVNKSCATPAKKNSRSLKKDHGYFGKKRGVISKCPQKTSTKWKLPGHRL